MNTYKIVATLRLVLFALAIFGVSQSLLAQGETSEPTDSEDNTLVVKADRSHAGGSRYIPVTLRLGNRGISWRYEDDFERHVDIPWSALKKWSCWGERHGYKLELLVEEPEDGGGTFKLQTDKLKQTETYLLQRVPEKAHRRCQW